MLTRYNSFENWVVFEILLVLEEMSVLSYIREHKSVRTMELAKAFDFEEKILVETLSLVSQYNYEFITLDKEFVGAGPALYDPVLENMMNFVAAYRKDLSNLSVAMRKGDFAPTSSTKKTRHLNRSSDIYSKKIREAIVSRIESYARANQKNKTVLMHIDLGCGGGLLSKEVLSGTELNYSVGIDTSIESEIYTKQEDGKTLAVVKGDVSAPKEWVQRVLKYVHLDQPSLVVLTMVTVAHEIADTDKHFCAFIEELRSVIPAGKLIIAEQNYFLPSEVHLLKKQNRVSVAFYQLMHHLTNQGLPRSQKSWIELFGEANLNLVSVTNLDDLVTLYETEL